MREPAPVRILLLEDQDDDAALIEREIRNAGLATSFHRAMDRPTFIAGLRDFAPDLILSDHNLIGFTGSDALGIAVAVVPDVPFVFVSGTIGEEAAIEALHRGATDYVIKDRLSRLVPVVHRALAESAGRRERDRLQREFVRAQKMESLGRMASAIAHDFNNILAIIVGSGSLLADSVDEPDTVRRLTGQVVGAAERGRELTARLLAFSRNHAAEIREFDLTARVRDFEPMGRTLAGTGFEVRPAYHPAPLMVRGDPARIDQVLLNLVANARDAMPGGGVITVTTSRLDSPELPPSGFDLAPPGVYAVLGVEDTGAGMTPEIRARVFEPFFTTKPAGQGTGLGLATVYGIVQQFAGAIRIDTAPGRGTGFRLLFPLSGGGAEVPLTGLRVLLAEDEELVRGYAREVLDAAGCVVVEAASGREALDLAERSPTPFELVVANAGLPGLDGVELGRRILSRVPATGCVVMSGLPEVRRRAEQELPGAAFVAKPFGPGELTRAARAALRRPA